MIGWLVFGLVASLVLAAAASELLGSRRHLRGASLGPNSVVVGHVGVNHREATVSNVRVYRLDTDDPNRAVGFEVHLVQPAGTSNTDADTLLAGLSRNKARLLATTIRRSIGE